MLFYDEDLHIFYSRSQVMASIVILFDLLLIAICILKSAAFTKMMYSSDSDEEFITKRVDRGIFQLKFSELRG